MNQIQVVKNLVYQENTGTAGLLDLYLPRGKENAALLILFHGGGLEGGDKEDCSGVLAQLASLGIAVASPNYRMYPDAAFPQYVEDAAKAVAWSLTHVKEYLPYNRVFVGGISAGAYLSMMLHFQPRFLAECGVKEADVAGYIFDAGQPTVHYNILRERGEDPKAVRIDEAAPLYYLTGEKAVNSKQRYLVLVSDNDIAGRKEQNELMIRTMETHQYESAQIEYVIMKGYGHTEYVGVTDGPDHYPYAALLYEFLKRPDTDDCGMKEPES